MLANPNAMQVPCFATLSGTTVSKATDYGSHSGVTAPNLQAPIAKAHRPDPPFGGCTVHAQGVKSWGDGFIWEGFGREIKARIACTVAGPKRHGPQYLSDDGTVSQRIFYGELYSHITLKISRAATLAE
jgi:hypothetical protein